MRSRARAVACAAPLLVAVVVAAEASRAESDPFSGTFYVEGVTEDVRTGATRAIAGHVVLSKRGEVYHASAQLATDYPTSAGAVHSDVIGTGEARLRGDALEGEASTQLVLQRVPGVDPDFACVPREVGPRIVSSFAARLEPDGALVVLLSNRPAAGETYAATTTKLRGERVAMPGGSVPESAP